MLSIALLLVVIISLAGIVYKTHKIMAKLSSLAPQLAAIETVLTKVVTEVEALKNQLGDVELPADAQATLDRLVALGTKLDELNADA